VLRAFNNLAFLYAESGQEGKAELCYARALVHLDKLAADTCDKTKGTEGDADLHSHMLNNFASLLMGAPRLRARPAAVRALAGHPAAQLPRHFHQPPPTPTTTSG
jgi:hypothetical protein